MLYSSLKEALRIRAEKGQYITHQSYDELLDPAAAWGARLRLVDFASNDTLSIARDPRVANVYKDAIAKLAVSPLGATGSRGTSGNTPFHQELERRLALFHNSEAAVLFNSGYDANLTLWQTLPQPGDAIVYDEFAHASIIDGLRRSRANSKIKFSHNSLLDLGNILRTLSGDSKFSTGQNNVFIAVEAVHSMNGTMAALRKITTLIKEIFPRENAFLIVDEAHSTGVYGERGTGLCNQLQLENDIPIRVHTFGKAIGCAGGICFNLSHGLPDN
ncbi:hypothetical protein H072_20 [Dactylellina haptotyla CBS 200.50]|uniref:Aminotransferase class I/classII large domain-containing protein n=1 Tax=Dactylellina haptotyla (strain CBS 200.50) TaxID=1284197 RepID=S8CE78_DACHA|nr:hypothetical protein H072_20 [Dactylellina haptotyla CBS 200.50]